MRVLVALTACLAVAAPAGAEDRTALLVSTGRALQAQLACLGQPQPGVAIRAMLRNRVIAPTRFHADGSKVYRPTGELRVFGKPVLFVTGWAEEGGRVRAPFSRGPGTAPPRFLAVVLDAAPGEVAYEAHAVRGPDGSLDDPFSVIELAHAYYSKRGTSITCYGGPE